MGLLSYESSKLPRSLLQQHVGQLGTASRIKTTTRQLNEMAGDALLSSHRAISQVQLVTVHFCDYWLYSRENTHLTRTHSFAVRPRKAKKPRDSNETLQDRRGEERGAKGGKRREEEYGM